MGCFVVMKSREGRECRHEERTREQEEGKKGTLDALSARGLVGGVQCTVQCAIESSVQ